MVHLFFGHFWALYPIFMALKPYGLPYDDQEAHGLRDLYCEGDKDPKPAGLSFPQVLVLHFVKS
jgi:hypothetical protein